MQSINLEWDEKILSRYNVSGPRYTSYPTALEFSADYKTTDYLSCLNNISNNKSLALYIHIPFCENICYYCACNKIITKNYDKSIAYVNYLIKEIKIVAAQSAAKSLRQIHWGGGTPTYLSVEQIESIMITIRECFLVSEEEDTEISIEVDPRSLAINDIKKLATLGFNRMSLGVQDFDAKVQQSINRVQSFEEAFEMVKEARKQGFKSINLDLIYGLPHQSIDTFKATLKKVIQISPDRISVFNYAHLPDRFKSQRLINSECLPSAIEKLEIFDSIIRTLQAYDYLFIGMDHFAKADDELAIAQNNHCLHRNFQGYTTHQEYELIGVGVSSIGSISNQYHQNVRDIKSYYNLLDQSKLPSWRGVAMTEDDKIRKAVIFDLICHFEVSKQEIELNFGIKFDDYFADELVLISQLVKDKLILLDTQRIKITPRGRLLVRNICMIFDAYLNELILDISFSKII
ncbi:MAG: oxygen-independent coproporphyrinogen-3 oxidase [Enterobacterales bacterium]|jgi:oxygen-independent coproporphyrinogen-3 oxidase